MEFYDIKRNTIYKKLTNLPLKNKNRKSKLD